MYYLLLYSSQDSKILKIRDKISSMSSLVKISITRLFPPTILCFQNGDVCKGSEPIFTFVQEKNYIFVSKKMEVLQENTNMIYRYYFVRVIN